jgi:hypothetical protein
VAIGSDGTVTPGALLDLSQATDAGGLLLPQIESADTLIEELRKPGMLVYNKTDGKVYTYNGTFWAVGGGGSDTPLMNVAITPSIPVALYSTGGLKQLNPAISIADSTTIVWKSSNTDVAVVSDKGIVSPVADGNADITVSFGSLTSDPVAVTVTTPTCGLPFTAPSDKVYNTANYSNTGLTNLCWTTTNLQEAGQIATCYSNNCTSYPTRGYYYTVGNASAACAALNGDGAIGWRLATLTEHTALKDAFPNLEAGVGTVGTTSTLQAAWNSIEHAAGGNYTNGGTRTWDGWNQYLEFFTNEAYDIGVCFNVGAGAWIDNNNVNGAEYWPLRCVRDL